MAFLVNLMHVIQTMVLIDQHLCSFVLPMFHLSYVLF